MNKAALSAILALTSPAAAAGADWTEVPIEAPGPDGPLAGTLVDLPGEGQPVVLIVPGSGPTDRDGNNPVGIAAANLRMLAHGLAERGIASVRIDKRGMFGSAGAIADPNAVTIADYADDLHSWVDAIRGRRGAECVWVLGHSEGGLVALAAATRAPAGICGLVLAGAPGQGLADVVRAQLRANPANAPILAEAEHSLAELEAGRHVAESAISPPLMPLFAPPVQDYLIDLFRYDPAALIARIELPVLLLYGTRDMQTPLVEGQRLAAAAPKAELAVIETANHVFKSVPSDDREANLATYADPSLPLASRIVERIAAFVTDASRR